MEIPKPYTLEFSKYVLEVTQAHINGKDIEVQRKSDIGRWFGYNNDGSPMWNWEVFNYRIKPQPKTVPLTADDIPSVCWLRKKGNTVGVVLQYLVVRVGFTEIAFGQDSSLSFYDLANGWEYSSDRKVWKPCHKVEN